jgi:molybdenum cofactor biosynthesis enzyme MoaA
MDRGMDISFIEEMPLGQIGDHDRAAAYYASDAIRADLGRELGLIPTIETTGGPSRDYRVAAPRSDPRRPTFRRVPSRRTAQKGAFGVPSTRLSGYAKAH